MQNQLLFDTQMKTALKRSKTKTKTNVDYYALVAEVFFLKEKSKTSASREVMSSSSTWDFSFRN